VIERIVACYNLNISSKDLVWSHKSERNLERDLLLKELWKQNVLVQDGLEGI
jgi:hypothetical protein